MSVYTLTEPVYGNDRNGPFRLYIYEADGFHRGGVWAYKGGPTHYPNDPCTEISTREMMMRAVESCAQGKEVRITDGGDLMIYHAIGGKILYPDSEAMKTFWQEITSS